MKLLTKEILAQLPALYAQEHMGDAAIVYVRFFTTWSNWSWYATEFNPETGIFFGLVKGMETELGYFSLHEFETLNSYGGRHTIERDLYFKPTTLSELR